MNQETLSPEKNIEFPTFRKLEVADDFFIKKVTANFKPSTVFNLTCLFAWHDVPSQISFLKENIVLKTDSIIDKKTVFTLLGEKNLLESIERIFKNQELNNLSKELHFIPEEVLLAEPKIQELFLVKEERDFFNYVYFLDKFREMSGNKMRSHRNSIHHFLNEYPDISVEFLEFNPMLHEKIVLDVFFAWEALKNRTAQNDEKELEAIKTLFDLSKEMPFQIIFLKDAGRTIGFCIFELAQKEFIIAHFLKIFPSYRGAEELIFQQIAEEFFPKGYRYFNSEEDLGIESLRRHKTSLHPEFFIKQYAIYPK